MKNGETRCVMVTVVGNGHGDTSPNPNTLGKGMNPSILPPATDKY